MTITGISTNVQAIISSLSWVVDCLPQEPEGEGDFSGYPSVCHYYTDTESNYATVSQNRRVIEYIVELYLITPSGTSSATELSEMYTHIDNLVQTLDESIDLSDTGLGLSPACDIMRPVPGTLERIKIKDGTGRMMTIRLFCEADVSFR